MRQGEDLCTSTVTQALVAEYCRYGYLDSHMKTILSVYSEKCGAMQDALTRHLPTGAASWSLPEGGFFFWIELARDSSRDLFDRAVAEKVAFVPGAAFYPGEDEQIGEIHTGERFARLCFTFADNDAIDEGCRRLARAIAE
jgi:2-aminoadipate transaminase